MRRAHAHCNAHAHRPARRDVDAERWEHDLFEGERPAAAPVEGDLRGQLSGRVHPGVRAGRTSEPRRQPRPTTRCPEVRSLAQFLDALNLAHLLPLFEAEEVDMAALSLCTDADLQALGVPLGPRKKLLAMVTGEMR